MYVHSQRADRSPLKNKTNEGEIEARLTGAVASGEVKKE